MAHPTRFERVTFAFGGHAHGWIPCGREAWLKRSNENKSLLRGVGLALIVGHAAANDAKESVSAGVIVVFGAARGAYCPNAADQTKPHNRPRVLQRRSPFRPFRVSTTQRRNAQRRAATFAASSLGHRPHTAPVPHVQHNRDRDRHRKRNHDNKQQQRDGHSAHGRMIASEGRERLSKQSRSLWVFLRLVRFIRFRAAGRVRAIAAPATRSGGRFETEERFWLRSSSCCS
jgi:hypothetical protein